MVKVYAVSLVMGVVGLLVIILGGAFAESLGRESRDPGERIGVGGRSAIAGLTGFGMAGLSAEFSTFDLSWPAALIVALGGAVAAALWAWFVSRPKSGSDAGPV
jgi:hypothetical protein